MGWTKVDGKDVYDPVDFEPTTDFGRKLKEVRARMIASGLPLLTAVRW